MLFGCVGVRGQCVGPAFECPSSSLPRFLGQPKKKSVSGVADGQKGGQSGGRKKRFRRFFVCLESDFFPPSSFFFF